MPFEQFKKAVLMPGKTVPLRLNMLQGEPVLHVEHIGDENVSYVDDIIAKAHATKQVGVRGKKLSRKMLAESMVENRRIVAAHAVRHVEALHSDGRAATDADIPELVASLPDDVITTIYNFASDAENFRERPIEGDAKELAEK